MGYPLTQGISIAREVTHPQPLAPAKRLGKQPWDKPSPLNSMVVKNPLLEWVTQQTPRNPIRRLKDIELVKLNFVGGGDSVKKSFVQLLENYAQSNNITYNKTNNDDQTIQSILMGIPEGAPLPDWLTACTAKSPGESKLKGLLASKSHSLLEMSGKSQAEFEEYLKRETGLELEEIQELMLSERFLVPTYVAHTGSSIRYDTTYAPEVGYTHALIRLIDLTDSQPLAMKSSSIENLFKSLCPNHTPKIKTLLDMYKKEDGNNYFAIHSYRNGITRSGGRLFRYTHDDAKTWAIKTNSNYMLDFMIQSGYPLTKNDFDVVLSAPTANRYAWKKLKEEFNISDTDALEIIKKHLSSQSNQPSIQPQSLSAIELYIDETINVAEANKLITRAEREAIKKQVDENSDRIHLLIFSSIAVGSITAGFAAIIYSLKQMKKTQNAHGNDIAKLNELRERLIQAEYTDLELQPTNFGRTL